MSILTLTILNSLSAFLSEVRYLTYKKVINTNPFKLLIRSKIPITINELNIELINGIENNFSIGLIGIYDESILEGNDFLGYKISLEKGYNYKCDNKPFIDIVLDIVKKNKRKRFIFLKYMSNDKNISWAVLNYNKHYQYNNVTNIHK